MRQIKIFLALFFCVALSYCATPAFHTTPGLVLATQNTPESLISEYNAHGKTYPLQSSPAEIRQAVKNGEKQLKERLTPQEIEILNFFSTSTQTGNDSFSIYKGSEGFTPARRYIHRKILDKLFNSTRDSIDPTQPDAYILGGMAGSGKTGILSKLITESVISINPDSMKAELAKYDSSPLTNWPLAHAGYLHEESTYLAKLALKRAQEEKRNILYEKTISSSVQNIINEFNGTPYKLHLLATQIYPHIAIERVVYRLFHGSEGRYVPISLVASNGNTIQKNIINARTQMDSYVIIDTSILNGVTIVDGKGPLYERAKTHYPD